MSLIDHFDYADLRLGGDMNIGSTPSSMTLHLSKILLMSIIYVFSASTLKILSVEIYQ